LRCGSPPLGPTRSTAAVQADASERAARHELGRRRRGAASCARASTAAAALALRSGATASPVELGAERASAADAAVYDAGVGLRVSAGRAPAPVPAAARCVLHTGEPAARGRLEERLDARARSG
jgi:hypothetical protein